MTGVRVLVRTRKGSFVLTADRARKDSGVSGPYFSGWEVAASPSEPNRIWATPSGGWFGQEIQRSGRRWRHLGAGRQRVPLRHRPRHAPVV